MRAVAHGFTVLQFHSFTVSQESRVGRGGASSIRSRGGGRDQGPGNREQGSGNRDQGSGGRGQYRTARRSRLVSLWLQVFSIPIVRQRRVIICKDLPSRRAAPPAQPIMPLRHRRRRRHRIRRERAGQRVAGDREPCGLSWQFTCRHCRTNPAVFLLESLSSRQRFARTPEAAQNSSRA